MNYTSLLKLATSLTIILLFVIPSNAQFPPEMPWGVPINPDTISMPGYLETVSDNTYNVNYTRLGDVAAFEALYGFPLSDASTRHQYAKIQAWNADGSMLHFGSIFFLNGADYTLNKTISWAGINDSRWSNTEPNILYFCDENFFKKIDVITEVVTVLDTFPTYASAGIGPWEGNLSADDRYAVITDYNVNGEGVSARVYDIVNDIKLGNYSGNFDWASMTPSGDYVIVSNNITQQIERYDLNFQNMFVVTSGQQHGDIGVDINGDEVFVQVIPLSMTRLSDGVSTDLLPATASTSGTCDATNYNPNIAGHISCRNFDLPGWAIVSAGTHPCWNDHGYDWRTEVFAVKLDYTGLGTIRHYGHSRTSASSSIATVSQDGEKILFASDWDMYGNGSGDNLTYLVTYDQALPVNWLSPFSAIIEEDITRLSWSTTEEFNSNKFIIEHSGNGVAFSNVGQLMADHARKEKTYHAIHQKPLPGINYYRLKQVDIDGGYQYSDVVEVQYQPNEISIFPIPTDGELQIYSSKASGFSIFNQLGEHIKEGRLFPGNNKIDLSHFDAGVYFLRSRTAGVKKIVVY